MHCSIVNLLIKKRMLTATENVLLRKKVFKKSGFMNELGSGRGDKGGGQYS